nr:DUF262 domain-containing protein [uncultured Rhodococcus sp.]
MKTSATNKKIRVILTGIRDEVLIPNPNFQRRLVWSNAHKVALIRTVLDGLPFPEIFIAAGEVDPDTGDGTELIVDGQQRITTLNQYFTAHVDLKLTASGGVPPYKDLEDQAKLDFLAYEVVVRDLGKLTSDETISIFKRINSTNYALNAMEVNNSRYDGELKRFAERLAARDFFVEHKTFTSLDGRRMNDIRFTLTLIISMMSGYFNRDDDLEEYLERFNDEFPDERQITDRIDRVVHLLEKANLGRKSRIWNKADMLTAFIELDRVLNIEQKEIDAAAFSDSITKFYEDVANATESSELNKSASEYYRRITGGINDRTNRLNRGDAFREAVLGPLI